MPKLNFLPKRRLLPLLLVALIVGGACQSPFVANLRHVFENEQVAIFAIPAEEFPKDREVELPAVQQLPAMTEQQVRALLGAISYRKETIWGHITGPVFYGQELEFIAPTIAQAIPKLGPTDRLVVVSRYDPDRSVLSRLERVSLMLWQDAAGLNVIFGEIRYEIPHNDYYEIQDWTNILPISIRQPFPYHQLVGPDFKLKEVNGFTHKTWAIFDPTQVAALKYRPEPREKGTDRVRRNFGDRRRTLKKMRDSGLISKSEYQEKEREIARGEKRQLLREALESGLVTRQEYEAKLRELEPESKQAPKHTKGDGPDEPKGEDPKEPKGDGPDEPKGEDPKEPKGDGPDEPKSEDPKEPGDE